MNKPVTSRRSRHAQGHDRPAARSRKVYSRPEAAPDLRVPLREIALEHRSGEPPLPVYDTTGPYTDPDVDDRRREGPAAHAHRMGEGARRRRAI